MADARPVSQLVGKVERGWVAQAGARGSAWYEFTNAWKPSARSDVCGAAYCVPLYVPDLTVGARSAELSIFRSPVSG